MDKSDEELVAEWQRGATAAYEALVRRHTPGVYSFVRRLIKDTDAAEDVSQETFVKAWRALKQFRSGSRFTPWLFRIARNSATDYLRKKKPQLFSSMQFDEQPFEETLRDVSPDAEEALIAAEESVMILKDIDTLSQSHQEILMLRYQEGMTFEEAAEALQISVNTAKSRGRRALLALRSAMHPTHE